MVLWPRPYSVLRFFLNGSGQYTGRGRHCQQVQGKLQLSRCVLTASGSQRAGANGARGGEITHILVGRRLWGQAGQGGSVGGPKRCTSERETTLGQETARNRFAIRVYGMKLQWASAVSASWSAAGARGTGRCHRLHILRGEERLEVRVRHLDAPVGAAAACAVCDGSQATRRRRLHSNPRESLNSLDSTASQDFYSVSILQDSTASRTLSILQRVENCHKVPAGRAFATGHWWHARRLTAVASDRLRGTARCGISRRREF